MLTPDESARAARFKFDHLRRSFILARGALRLLLARYLDADPTTLRFTYGEKGKPALADPHRLRFNTSHSAGMALYAFTLDVEIGVDIEQIRPLHGMAGIATRFFCAEETAELMGLPAAQQEAAFFRCWTRKEAYIKAIGDGLAVPLDDFAVSFLPDQPTRFVHIRGDQAGAWTLQNLEPASGYAAAVAYRDATRALRQSVLEL